MLLSLGMADTSHHLNKAIKKEAGIPGAGAGLRMELNSEAVLLRIVQSFAAAVVGVDIGQPGDARHGIAVHGIAVILAGDVASTGGAVLHRLVAAPVAVFQLIGFSAHGQGHELMPQADAENGQFSSQFLQLGNTEGILLRVSGTVGEHQPVRVPGENFFCRGVLRQHGDPAAPGAEAEAAR